MLDADLRQQSQRVGIPRPALNQFLHQPNCTRAIESRVGVADRKDQRSSIRISGQQIVPAVQRQRAIDQAGDRERSPFAQPTEIVDGCREAAGPQDRPVQTIDDPRLADELAAVAFDRDADDEIARASRHLSVEDADRPPRRIGKAREIAGQRIGKTVLDRIISAQFDWFDADHRRIECSDGGSGPRRIGARQRERQRGHAEEQRASRRQAGGWVGRHRGHDHRLTARRTGPGRQALIQFGGFDRRLAVDSARERVFDPLPGVADAIAVARLPARAHHQPRSMFAARIEACHLVRHRERPLDIARLQPPFRHREHLANDRFALMRALDRKPVVPRFVDAVEIGQQPDVVSGQPVQNHGDIVRRARGVKQRNIVDDLRAIDRDRFAIGLQQRRRGARPGLQFDEALPQAGMRLCIGAAAPEERAQPVARKRRVGEHEPGQKGARFAAGGGQRGRLDSEVAEQPQYRRRGGEMPLGFDECRIHGATS